jgi:hypothetical protein
MKKKQNKTNCTLIFIIGLGAAICTAGCVKQRNCDCGLTGTFVYLKEPYEAPTNCATREKIVAEFNSTVLITGYVPHKFQSGDSIKVRLCGEYVCKKAFTFSANTPTIFKLKCIERE